MVTAELSLDNVRFEIRLNLEAWRDAVQARDWNNLPNARKYFAEQTVNPAIYSLIHNYHYLDAQFFQWLDTRQHVIHGADLEILKRLELELRDKYIEAGINPDEILG